VVGLLPLVLSIGLVDSLNPSTIGLVVPALVLLLAIARLAAGAIGLIRD